MQSNAPTVEAYLHSLPENRRAAIEAVRSVILKNIDEEIEEGIQYGHIGYYIPKRRYPAGYHCDNEALPYLGLASQKEHIGLYLHSIHYGCFGDPGTEHDLFRQEWAKTGKKLNMGRSCIRFKKVEDLALDVIANAIRQVPVDKFITYYEASIPPSAAKKKGR